MSRISSLAVEPLVISIRNHPSIEPTHVGNEDHYISFNAEDSFFWLNPKQSIPLLSDLINTFGGVSRYTINWTINWQKSKFMSLNADLDL